MLKQANELESQFGAYIGAIVEGGPADRAGLRGTQDVAEVEGIDVPVGGDVVVEINGQPVQDFDGLLSQISFRQPGDAVELTVVRDGQCIQRTVTLDARPGNRGQN